jgi:hypothetical protein
MELLRLKVRNCCGGDVKERRKCPVKEINSDVD